MIDIRTNLAAISDEIQALIAKKPELCRPTIIAVSKKQPVHAIQAAAEAGQQDFGENYLQEALVKINALKAQQLNWHFIGAIQSNKTRAIAENFNWVHTVDRLKIAQRLSKNRPDALPPLNICLQINVDNDPAKAGVSADLAQELAEQISSLPRITLRGLMTITAQTHADEREKSFAAIKALFDQLKTQLDSNAFDTLSMGMSADWQQAVTQGANLVRIGTAIFGPRSS